MRKQNRGSHGASVTLKEVLFMKQPEEQMSQQLSQLLESGLITGPESNLRSKMGSLLRSIENLTQKKLRIEYQIKVQKRSLARKREELKKASKHFKVTLESASSPEALYLKANSSSDLKLELDEYLLQESFRILDSD